MTPDLATLHGEARSSRTRLLGPPAPGALHRGYDVWSPVDYWLSEFREAYLRGEVKGVIASIPTKNSLAFESFCIVPVPPAAQSAYAARHRQALLEQIQHQYKSAVVRAASGGRGRQARRRRHRVNAQLGTVAPSIDAVDTLFADRPDALAFAAPIRAAWHQVAGAQA